MDLKKTLGFGVALWVLMFVVVSALMAFGVYQQQWGKALTVAIVAVVVYTLAGYAKPRKAMEALTLGASWVVIGILLDFFVTAKFNAAIFEYRTLWVGYVITFLLPLARTKK